MFLLQSKIHSWLVYATVDRVSHASMCICTVLCVCMCARVCVCTKLVRGIVLLSFPARIQGYLLQGNTIRILCNVIPQALHNIIQHELNFQSQDKTSQLLMSGLETCVEILFFIVAPPGTLHQILGHAHTACLYAFSFCVWVFVCISLCAGASWQKRMSDATTATGYTKG